MITSSAPGKIILLGEHAVCFGKPAIATAVNLRTYVRIDKSYDECRLELDNLQTVFSWPIEKIKEVKLSDEFTEKTLAKLDEIIDDLIPKKTNLSSAINSLRSFLFLYFSLGTKYRNSNYQPLNVKISSELPIGSGFGSSAAFSVSLTGALFKFYGLKENLDDINNWAFYSEKIFHGKPSGIDNTIATYGGCLFYKDGEKQFTRTSLKLIVADTQIQRDCKKLVQLSNERKKMFPSIVNHIMDAIGEISEIGWKIITNEDTKSNLETLIEINHNLLNSFGVGHKSIDKAVKIANSHGFYAKLSGAGGGGIVIIYGKNDEKLNLMKNELEEKGFKVYFVYAGSNGLEIMETIYS